ncbi:MAG: 7-cyano-7-deazaguanine synthase [Elusimicrobia bacterium]|nr:7-cyano-7-deazaguanine synthase [Elusimicrobiota bacterium]
MSNGRVVVMLSGGLDSYLAYRWAQAQGRDVLGVWADLGQPYREKEYTAVQALGVSARVVPCGILRTEWGNMPTPEKQIIRARNGLLALIGALFGQEVWIVALDGEMHPYMLDKNAAFFEASGRYFGQIIGEPITVATPFADKTKADLVRWALGQGITPEEMSRSVTCYDPSQKACGRCSACFKRWMAMELNGVHEAYDSKPWESEWAKGYIPKVAEALRSGNHDHYSRKRCEETLAALKLVGIEPA